MSIVQHSLNSLVEHLIQYKASQAKGPFGTPKFSASIFPPSSSLLYHLEMDERKNNGGIHRLSFIVINTLSKKRICSFYPEEGNLRFLLKGNKEEETVKDMIVQFPNRNEYLYAVEILFRAFGGNAYGYRRDEATDLYEILFGEGKTREEVTILGQAPFENRVSQFLVYLQKNWKKEEKIPEEIMPDARPISFKNIRKGDRIVYPSAIFPKDGGGCIITELHLVDEKKQKLKFTLMLFPKTLRIGLRNGGKSIRSTNYQFSSLKEYHEAIRLFFAIYDDRPAHFWGGYAYRYKHDPETNTYEVILGENSSFHVFLSNRTI